MTQEIIPPSADAPATEPPVIIADDKTAIVMALREVARAIEQNAPNYLDLMQAIGTECLVLALKTGATDIEPATAEALARREVSAIAQSMAAFHNHYTTEVEILNERLVRQFDPALAWNEAINRAIAAKKAAKEEVVEMTTRQQMMFDSFQKPFGMRALQSA